MTSPLAELLRDKARRTFGTFMPNALFEALSPESQSRVSGWVGDQSGHPILGLGDENSWIVLTDSHLIHAMADTVNALALGSLGPGYTVRSDDPAAFDKARARWVRFDGSDIWLQAPSAESLSLLLNILQVVFNSNAKAITPA